MGFDELSIEIKPDMEDTAMELLRNEADQVTLERQALELETVQNSVEGKSNCDGCKVLKSKILNLQKKVSYLKKRNIILSEKLSHEEEAQAADVDVGHEDSDVNDIFYNDTAPDCEYSSSQESSEINWSSLEEESENSDAGDDEESNPNSSFKVE